MKLTVGRFGRAYTRGAGVLSSSESLSDSDESDSWLLLAIDDMRMKAILLAPPGC